jgi:hypothetical protein
LVQVWVNSPVSDGKPDSWPEDYRVQVVLIYSVVVFPPVPQPVLLSLAQPVLLSLA